MDAPNESIEVVNSAIIRDLETAIATEDVSTVTSEGKGLGSSAHRSRDGRDTRLDVDGDGSVRSGGNDDSSGLVNHGDHEDGILIKVRSSGFGNGVAARCALGVGAVIVDKFFFGDGGGGRAGFESRNVGSCDVSPGIMSHSLDPFDGTSITTSVDRGVIIMQRADVVRFAKVIPGNEFQELGVNLEDLVPASTPKSVREEDPVLVIGVSSVVGVEPG